MHNVVTWPNILYNARKGELYMKGLKQISQWIPFLEFSEYLKLGLAGEHFWISYLILSCLILSYLTSEYFVSYLISLWISSLLSEYLISEYLISYLILCHILFHLPIKFHIKVWYLLIKSLYLKFTITADIQYRSCKFFEI